jgi:hypothetical protein
MRFIMLYKRGRKIDRPPTRQEMEAVGQSIRQMAKGTLVAADGPQPSSRGECVRISGKRFSVTDGPFAETKDFAGYAIVQPKSKEDAIEWAKRFLDSERRTPK